MRTNKFDLKRLSNKAIQAAETQVLEFINSQKKLLSPSGLKENATYFRKLQWQSQGPKAVRLAGYLTGKGLL